MYALLHQPHLHKDVPRVLELQVELEGVGRRLAQRRPDHLRPGRTSLCHACHCVKTCRERPPRWRQRYQCSMYMVTKSAAGGIVGAVDAVDFGASASNSRHVNNQAALQMLDRAGGSGSYGTNSEGEGRSGRSIGDEDMYISTTSCMPSSSVLMRVRRGVSDKGSEAWAPRLEEVFILRCYHNEP
jgi:hypothetical protein